ncbi:hypothetical protein [Angustibacter sp. Root456]|uniref:hypothetical protein n=1 Tax=Angustibacter sp. Root456 TaxID=1736539 RepID=UPI0019104791|nr:hypothetical protein [Angustibacter sp. Root456]
MSEQPAATDAILAEAATKSGLVWLRPRGQARAWPAWHVWHEGAVVVVSGPGEQDLPPLDGDLDLLLRSKDTGARILTVPARGERLDPDDERWAPAVEALAGSRLNSHLLPAQLPAHWREVGAVVTRVEAAGAPTEQPGDYSTDSHAAPPPPTPATTAGWRPFHLRGRRRRRLFRRS